MEHAIYEDDYGKYFFGQTVSSKDAPAYTLANVRQIFPTLKNSVAFAAGLGQNCDVGPVIPSVTMRTIRTAFAIDKKVAQKIYAKNTVGE
jgi:hypothetical protein